VSRIASTPLAAWQQAAASHSSAISYWHCYAAIREDDASRMMANIGDDSLCCRC